MRTIKFRAWDKEKKQICEVADISWDNHGCYEIRVSCGDSWYGLLEFELMQFTGLLDKNGKEIYEGDVVKIIYPPLGTYKGQERIALIKWGTYADGEYVSNVECWMAGDEPLSDPGGLWGSPAHVYEVIGNIHENPELIGARL